MSQWDCDALGVGYEHGVKRQALASLGNKLWRWLHYHRVAEVLCRNLVHRSVRSNPNP